MESAYYRLELIKDLEKVQMRATKLVISIKNFTYRHMPTPITHICFALLYYTVHFHSHL